MIKKPVILLVDDEVLIRKSVKMSLEPAYVIIEANDYESALNTFQKNEIDLTILDINYNSPKNGIDLLKAIKNLDPSATIMMLTSVTEISKVVESVRYGAFDYITKGSNSLGDEVAFRVRNCMHRILEKRSLEGIQQSFQDKYTIVSVNKKMRTIMDEISKVGDMNIMIEGETGVGKTPIARFANLAMSQTGERPFVRINCAGLSKERLQDEMFGHKKGSYTGADSDKKGLVEIAKDGDLFLDEVADLNMECQAEILTFLDSGEYRRLGDIATRHANCRVISAAN
jgi:DNA-binding NtrC family response regulator